MKPTTPEKKEFGEHFEATVAAAASADIPDAKRVEFFLPQNNGELNVRTNRVLTAIAARRMQEVEKWMNRELAKYLPPEVFALPPDERAAAIKAAGFFGREPKFADQAPGVTNMALYRRREDGGAELIAAMTFTPTFDGDKGLPAPVV